jgi:hypothetical protein
MRFLSISCPVDSYHISFPSLKRQKMAPELLLMGADEKQLLSLKGQTI